MRVLGSTTDLLVGLEQFTPVSTCTYPLSLKEILLSKTLKSCCADPWTPLKPPVCVCTKKPVPQGAMMLFREP